jgi:RNA binding exosome subunit
MKLANNVSVRVFAKEDEDKEAIVYGLLRMLPFNPEDEKLKIREQKAEGFGDKKIAIISITLEKDRHVNPFLTHLVGNLGRENETLVEQAESRLDDDLNFTIRLDKERLLAGKYVLTDGGKCYHIAMNLAAFPKKRETGLALIKQIFKNPG